MEQNNQVYAKLQKHLDNQAIGFPATRSGVEIKILKHIFTPEEAEIACCLSYKFEPLETIFSRLVKLKLTGKLIVDSVRTGHMDLLK